MNFYKNLADIKNQHLYRARSVVAGAQDAEIVIAGKKLINFCSNNYLALANNVKVKQAYKNGIDKYGASSAASHLVSGHSVAHQQLEEELAQYTKQQRALLFSNGYMANLGIFSALKSEINWVLQDKLNHASLIDANQLIGLPLQRYLHDNIDSLTKKINKQTKQGLVATDNVFSMDGDVAKISEINNIVSKKKSLLMQDDAHGFGVFDVNIPKDSIYMATFGKAAGTSGAFVAGNEDFIEFLMQKARPYIYTTALSPASCVATLASLEIIKQGEQREKLLDNIKFFKTLAKQLELPFLSSNSAIQPIIIGANDKTINIAKKLYEQGFYVGAIRPPTVANNSARLRITLSAQHTKTQIEQLLTQLKDVV